MVNSSLIVACIVFLLIPVREATKEASTFKVLEFCPGFLRRYLHMSASMLCDSFVVPFAKPFYYYLQYLFQFYFGRTGLAACVPGVSDSAACWASIGQNFMFATCGCFWCFV